MSKLTTLAALALTLTAGCYGVNGKGELVDGKPALIELDDTDSDTNTDTGTYIDTGVEDTGLEPVIDADGDSFTSLDQGGTDCDDNNAEAYPGNVELLHNGFDDDCDPTTQDDACAEGFGEVRGKYTAPEDTTIKSIGGKTRGGVLWNWTDWTNSPPHGMTTEIVNNVVTFNYLICLNDQVAWELSTEFTYPAIPAIQYSCQSSEMSGEWTVLRDGIEQNVEPYVWDPDTGACSALVTNPN
ncbi:MAG: putative metal-binding motif-containing protein [Patescibacteria group bacterium]